MTRYKLSFELETDEDPSSLLDQLIDVAGLFVDSNSGGEAELDEDSVCVENTER